MSLLDKLKKNSTIKLTSKITESVLFRDRDEVPTPIPNLNIALSGSIDGGLRAGLLQLVADSKHFKTKFALELAAAYQRKHKDAVVLFFDSEFGASENYFESSGVDIERLLHIPIHHIEELKFEIVKQFEGLKRGERVVVVVDSIGNLASKKELEDAQDEKSVQDMSRAKALASLFRIVTPYLKSLDIPMVVINHHYKDQGCFSGETLIKTVRGNVPIKDIVVGDLVYAVSGIKEVTHCFKPCDLPSEGKIFLELEFDDGTKVKCTDNHRFLIEDGTWEEAGNLRIGQRFK